MSLVGHSATFGFTRSLTVFPVGHHTRVLEVLAKAEHLPADESVIVDAIVACFSSQTSDLTVWLGAGRRLLENVWKYTDKLLALRVTGALLEGDWAGFKQVALPLFTKNTMGLLEGGQGKDNILMTVRILARLAHGNMLGEMDSERKAALATWINNFVSDLTISNESVRINETAPHRNYSQFIRVRLFYFKRWSI